MAMLKAHVDCESPSAGTEDNQSTKKTFRRAYTFRIKVASAFVATITALLVAELAVRIIGIAPELRVIAVDEADSPYQHSTNPILGYEHKVSYRNSNPDHVVSFGSTNAHGQRDIERSVQKPPGTQRIILLGDSVVESIEIAELDDLMNRQLEMQYRGGKTEVLNFGVNGYCTLAEVELLRTKGLVFDPDLVVLVFVKNDFNNFNSSAGGTAAALTHLQSVQNFDTNLKLVNHLNGYSHLFRMIFVTPQFNAFAHRHEALGDNNVVQGLEMLRNLSDEYRFDVLITIWPEFTDDGIIDPRSNHESDQPLVVEGTGELLIERLAAMYGLTTKRLSPGFKKYWQSLDVQGSPRSHFAPDSMHVNEAGSRAAAHVLKEVLREFEEEPKERLATRAQIELDAKAVDAASRLGESTNSYSLGVSVSELGAAADDEGQPGKALNYCQLAVQLDPNSAIAHYNLGRVLSAAGRSAEAIEHFRRALRIDDSHSEAHNDLGCALASQGKLPEAIDHFRSALVNSPVAAKVHKNLANAFDRQGSTDKAIQHCHKALESDSEYWQAHLMLGKLYLGKGKRDMAIQHLDSAVRIQPSCDFDVRRILERFDSE